MFLVMAGSQMLELVQRALTIRPRPTTAVQLSTMVREAVARILARPPVAMSLATQVKP